MIVSIVLGGLAGAVGFLPLVLGRNLARKASPTSNLGHAGALLLGVLLSFLIIAGAAVACIVVARSAAVPFVLAEAGALVVVAVVFGIARLASQQKGK